MRCPEWQKRLVELWEDGPSAELERHVTQCAACARHLGDLRLVRAGFGALRGESVPEPSLGFSGRLVRRLAEIGKRPAVGEFFELVGRRFVYATLALTFLAFLALVLPSSGPVRDLASADLLAPTQEFTQARLDPLSESGQSDFLEETAAGLSATPKGEK